MPYATTSRAESARAAAGKEPGGPSGPARSAAVGWHGSPRLRDHRPRSCHKRGRAGKARRHRAPWRGEAVTRRARLAGLPGVPSARCRETSSPGREAPAGGMRQTRWPAGDPVAAWLATGPMARQSVRRRDRRSRAMTSRKTPLFSIGCAERGTLTGTPNVSKPQFPKPNFFGSDDIVFNHILARGQACGCALTQRHAESWGIPATGGSPPGRWRRADTPHSKGVRLMGEVRFAIGDPPRRRAGRTWRGLSRDT